MIRNNDMMLALLASKMGGAASPGKELTGLNIVTPKQFGAVGDGEADDTAAVQAALDAAGMVYFPAGRYKVTSPLVVSKPCVIKMFRQYPDTWWGENNGDIQGKAEPLTPEDNYMGSRIETYANGVGLTLGDGCYVDGLFIRAMPGFTGTILKYDSKVGYWTYPSQVRIKNVRVDCDKDTEKVACLFDFHPTKSYHYILEDIQLGRHSGGNCEYAFRSDTSDVDASGTISMDKIGWTHNVYIYNMCINTRCDYGMYLDCSRSYVGWTFYGLTIQAYPSGHKALVKLSSKVTDLCFVSCMLWDTGGVPFSEGMITIDGSSITHHSQVPPGMQISCIGGSGFDDINSKLRSEYAAAENLNIKNLELTLSGDAATGGNNLSMKDGTHEKNILIPAATLSDEQIDTSVSKWMEENAVPKEVTGRNKFNPDDPNIFNGYVTLYGNGTYHEETSSSKQITTGFIPVKKGDDVRWSWTDNDITYKNMYDVYLYRDASSTVEAYIRTDAVREGEAIQGYTDHYTIEDEECKYVRLFSSGQSRFPAYDSRHTLMVTINDSDVTFEEYKVTIKSKFPALPPVTSDDNGKILKVVDGVWTAVEA